MLRTDYQRSIATYHHYGIGDYDPAVLEVPAARRDEAVIAERHRLETAQADVLLDNLGDITPADRLLDAGCGYSAAVMVPDALGVLEDVEVAREQPAFAG